MTAAFLAAVATTLGLRLWLASRHMRCVREHRDVVPEAFAERIPLEAHRKAADYTVARTRAALLELAARTVLHLAWTLGGGLDRLDALWPRGSAIAGAGFILGAYFLTELLLLPFAIHRVFRIEERFGFFLRALGYGTPPHAGIAPGLDRWIMIMCGESSIREVIAFPKTLRASSPMDGSPSAVAPEQLDELGLTLKDDDA